MKTLLVHGGRSLRGRVTVPGDKSISHRAAILGALASGVTRIKGYLRGEDCLSTLRCLATLGVPIEDDGTIVTVRGLGPEGAFREPAGPLDAGNSGTLMRLLAGVLATLPFATTLDGDASIRTRPMDRIARPLALMGASVNGRGERCLPPIRIAGGALKPIRYESPVASAQVKSCVLLAGCRTEGTTSVVEPAPSRDHTERMLAAFGAEVRAERTEVSVDGPAPLVGADVLVPGDISSAAFPLAAGLLVPGSEVTVERVGVNPTRTGLLDLLDAMGAAVGVADPSTTGGEPVADLTTSPSAMNGADVAGSLVPRMIDEFPIAALLACHARGETRVREAKELRVKESDRVESIAAMLRSFGAAVETREDGFAVRPSDLRPGCVDSHGDHRIAMAAVIAGLALEGRTTVRDTACIETSFPGFAACLRGLGADVEEVDA